MFMAPLFQRDWPLELNNGGMFFSGDSKAANVSVLDAQEKGMLCIPSYKILFRFSVPFVCGSKFFIMSLFSSSLSSFKFFSTRSLNMEDLRRRLSAVGELDNDMGVQLGLMGGIVFCISKMSLVLVVSMSSTANELFGYDYFQQIELSQEIRDLISTLPTEEGLISGHLHQYQGFWYPTMRIPRILATQKHFQAHDTDILLATTPKSGTTWLKAILFALVKRVHYHPHPQNMDHPLLTNNSHPLVPFLENKQQSGENQIPDANSNAPPRLFSTHLPLAHLPQSIKDSACKVIYLCRNPKDIVVSL
ncbi:hypothetical protein ACLB2K_036590 [Fragaria x ananassa]